MPRRCSLHEHHGEGEAQAHVPEEQEEARDDDDDYEKVRTKRSKKDSKRKDSKRVRYEEMEDAEKSHKKKKKKKKKDEDGVEDEDEHGPGWAIVDTGTKTPDVLAAWRQLIADAGPLAATVHGNRITRIFCTHMHPDHVGMAGWLTRKAQCRLWMTRLEYLTCRTLAADTGREAPDDAIRFYRQTGWPEEALDVYRARFGGFSRYLHALPDSFRRISDNEQIRIGNHTWRVIVGRGHSPEHACLVCDDLGVLVSGDQVLPKISSNVSVFPTEPDADPLGDWIASLAHLRATLGDHLLVLPAHGDPFRGLHDLRYRCRGQLPL